MQKPFLEAGQIVNTHGVMGDIKVQSWCDTPETLCQFDTLYLGSAHKPMQVTFAAVHKGMVRMHLAGVDTIEAAEALKNQMLYLAREHIALPDDLVFVQDILGFAVFDRRTEQTLGKLRDVLTQTGQDLYEIDMPSGRRIYIPAVKPFLKEIDMEQGVIYVETIEGLI